MDFQPFYDAALLSGSETDQKCLKTCKTACKKTKNCTAYSFFDENCKIHTGVNTPMLLAISNQSAEPVYASVYLKNLVILFDITSLGDIGKLDGKDSYDGI